ncbi:hypothetical protein R1sor_009923 [Riccia sorocarpa]|uniref:Uncharacterized protein n=1 Tax=Riccia sorocarpa TaxID=122646 RepID=A0ABD3I047_9MARC
MNPAGKFIAAGLMADTYAWSTTQQASEFRRIKQNLRLAPLTYEDPLIIDEGWMKVLKYTNLLGPYCVTYSIFAYQDLCSWSRVEHKDLAGYKPDRYLSSKLVTSDKKGELYQETGYWRKDNLTGHNNADAWNQWAFQVDPAYALERRAARDKAGKTLLPQPLILQLCLREEIGAEMNPQEIEEERRRVTASSLMRRPAQGITIRPTAQRALTAAVPVVGNVEQPLELGLSDEEEDTGTTGF